LSLTRSTARNPPDRTGQWLPNAGEVAWIGVADRLFPRADGVLPDSTADVDKEYALFALFIITGPEVPGVVTPSGMPGAIIEPLFLSNDGDAAVAARAEGKHAIVAACEHAIVEYFEQFPPQPR
jgi:hypothetical protein